jgi:hypothetical protein
MTDEECVALLRATFRPTGDERPARDLWPAVQARAQSGPRWSWVDLAMAAAAAAALAMNPRWLSLLTYHL